MCIRDSCSSYCWSRPYTGLRVGMASAKGLCYALKKPLITLGTLEVLTSSAIHQLFVNDIIETALFCPMIDARRMEVFTGIYDKFKIYIKKSGDGF